MSRSGDGSPADIPCDALIATTRLTRRAVLEATTGLALSGCTRARKWETRSISADKGMVVLDLKDYPALATAGGMAAFKPSDTKKPVLVMRIENDQFRVLSLKCPHLGCTVRWNNEIQLLECPCHGSKFDDTGRRLEGPAKTALRALPATREGTQLRFKTTQE
jgi:Rieske Fe-S protein